MRRDNILSGMSITGWLIVINVLCFLGVIFFGSFLELSISQFGLQPSVFLEGKCIWTLITYMFIHGNFWHLLINILVLFNLGIPYEVIMGGKRYLCFYLISGTIAGLTFVFFAHFFGSIDLESTAGRIFSGPFAITIGASGAIFAIAGLIVVLHPKARMVIIFLPFFSLPAYLMIPLFLFGMWFVSWIFGAPIGNTAHLGGFLSGLGYGLYLRYRYREKLKSNKGQR